MAYECLNGTQKCEELNPPERYANRPLPSRPPPERWEPFQPTERKRNKRKRLNESSIENTSTALPTVYTTSEKSSFLSLSPYKNLPSIIDATSPCINSVSINNTVSISRCSLISTHQPYLNILHVVYSSSTDYSYSNSNTLLSTDSNFEFPSSEQISSDIIHFLVHALPHTSPNNLQLVVLENMLIKHY